MAYLLSVLVGRLSAECVSNKLSSKLLSRKSLNLSTLNLSCISDQNSPFLTPARCSSYSLRVGNFIQFRTINRSPLRATQSGGSASIAFYNLRLPRLRRPERVSDDARRGCSRLAAANDSCYRLFARCMLENFRRSSAVR